MGGVQGDVWVVFRVTHFFGVLGDVWVVFRVTLLPRHAELDSASQKRDPEINSG